MANLDCIIWDVDGTLLESEELHRAAFNAAFAAKGLNWRWSRDMYAELLKTTGGKERILQYMQEHGGKVTAQVPAFASAEAEWAWVRELHEYKTGLFKAMLRSSEVELRPGVRRLIAQARGEGVRLAIATTTSRSNVTALLEHVFDHGEQGWAAIVAGEDVAKKKPSPDAYENVLAALDASPQQCVAVEDSHNGLAAAMAAGITTVVTPSMYTRDEDFFGAAAVFSHLGAPGAPADLLVGPADMNCSGVVDVEVLRSLLY